ncbi:CLUMA_CG004023, isoform A [Clunio marinus]|uniref:CLUMA_CG004023, isoform A n=1 Tax=Clunio marinus TaxID=568069 RepID=A0A1J1HQH1_9DIPT|nr:CLUMA_CG004023, isoform A [Clunio marinus]
MKLKKVSIRKKSVSPNLDTLDDFHDDEVCSNDDKQNSPVQRNTANARERARMRVLSSAFYRLKTIIPWVPHDTKLSKLDTLRLARNYIAYLTATLDGQPVNEITNKMPHQQKMTWPYIFQQVPDLNNSKSSLSSSKDSTRKSDYTHLTCSNDNFHKITTFDEESHISSITTNSGYAGRYHDDFEMNYD